MSRFFHFLICRKHFFYTLKKIKSTKDIIKIQTKTSNEYSTSLNGLTAQNVMLKLNKKD